MDINDLAPRIKELRTRQEGLLKTRVVAEAEMTLHGVQHVDAQQVKSYASDLRSLLVDTDFVRSKGFLRSFVEKIVIHGYICTIHYKLPVPSHWQVTEDVVLPIVPPSGAEWIRTPYLLDANETLSLLSYSHA